MIYPVNYGLNVSVEIVRDIEQDIAQIKVYAPLYINKEYILPNSYTSSQFTDYEILRDSYFIKAMLQRYGQK